MRCVYLYKNTVASYRPDSSRLSLRHADAQRCGSFSVHFRDRFVRFVPPVRNETLKKKGTPFGVPFAFSKADQVSGL